jgi:mRNA-degrading endonuclease RelE of RelBE toxin-antitoxin system
MTVVVKSNADLIVPRSERLTRFPAKDRERIGVALRSLHDDPFSGDIIRLEGLHNRWRRRVGNYRVFFAVDSPTNTVAISAIARRTSTTS